MIHCHGMLSMFAIVKCRNAHTAFDWLRSSVPQMQVAYIQIAYKKYSERSCGCSQQLDGKGCNALSMADHARSILCCTTPELMRTVTELPYVSKTQCMAQHSVDVLPECWGRPPRPSCNAALACCKADTGIDCCGSGCV